MSKDTKEAKTLVINWHNDATAILVNPKDDAPDNITSVEMTLMVGRTVPEGKGRPAWRVKALCDGAEFDAFPNAAKAVNAVLTAKFGSAKHHDVEAALADFKFPELDNSKPKEKDWDQLEDASVLKEHQAKAGEGAVKFFSGEADMRDGLYMLSQHVASVAGELTPRQFDAWVKSGLPELSKALINKNAKAEFTFVGRLPRDYFDMQPETTNSPKAYQRNFNIAKNDLAEQIAVEAWGKKKNAPNAAATFKAFAKVLGEMRGDMGEIATTAQQALARSMHSFLAEKLEYFSINAFVDGPDGIEGAFSEETGYIAPTQFGTGKRVHELVLAVIKAVAAMAPEAKAEAQETEQANKAAAAVNPRIFKDYGVAEAALHLAKILQSHDDWSDVLDNLNGMADTAEKSGWEEVISDTIAGIDADKAKEEAEATADDDA